MRSSRTTSGSLLRYGKWSQGLSQALINLLVNFSSRKISLRMMRVLRIMSETPEAIGTVLQAVT